MLRIRKQVGDHAAFNRGAQAYNDRDFYSAVEHFTEAVKEHPTYADYRFALAMSLREKGELELAIEQLREALKINPNYMQAKTELSILLAFSGRIEEAQSLYQEVVTQFIYHSDGSRGSMSRELLESFQQGIERLRSGGYSDAVIAFRVATNPKRSGMQEVHFNQAVELFVQEELEQARIELDQALKLDPYFLDAQMLLCRILQMEGENEEALQVCHRAIKIAPDYPDLHYYLALTCRSMDDYKRARKEFEKALELKPGYREAVYELADTCILMEDFHKAERSVQEYASMDGDPVRVQFLWGKLKESQGRYSEACEHYQNIAGKGKLGRLAAARLEVLQSVASVPED